MIASEPEEACTEEEKHETVKPYSFARASFRVLPVERGSRRNRRGKLMQEKEALSVGLTKSPYVEVSVDGKGIRALVDSGADWSLMCYDQLTGEERRQLQHCSMEGQGVSKETIHVVGELSKDVEIGGIVAERQRFVVVKDMITAMILGADFWVRFGEMTIDFQRSRLMVKRVKLDIPLYDCDVPRETAEPEEEEKGVVRMISETTVPPFSECIVKGKVPEGCLREGGEVLVEPLWEQESVVGIPYTVCRVDRGTVMFRVANVSDQKITLTKNEAVGLVSGNCTVKPRARKPATGRGPVTERLNCGKNLSDKQEHELREMLQEYSDVFYEGGELPVVRVGVEHRIRLKDNTAPLAFQPRRLSREAEEEVRKEIKELLDMGVIRPSNSPWAAPIVCARRQDGSLRLALDYRALNAVSLPATLHPIPRIDDLVDRLADSKYFSMLDAKCGYHQLPLEEDEAELTAFVVPWGQYEFCGRTPFGLKGAGYSFQRMMSVVLNTSNYVDAVCYLDDILVWATTWEEHKEKLYRVLEKIRNSGMKLSAKKCVFGTEEVNYLGAIIKNGMMSIGEQRTEQLLNIPRPTTVTELRRALGAFAYVQRWLPGLADVAKPLYSIVGSAGNKVLRWNDACEEAFSKLKEMVAKAVSLRIPRDGLPFVLVTDASDVGTGAMLAQQEGDVLAPVAFFHHTLNEAEAKYNTTEKELLAVVKACTKFRVYLGKPFELITDHHALRWLQTLSAEDARGRRGRWIDFLQQFEIKTVHKKGKSPMMSMADYLSRVTTAPQPQGKVAPLQWKGNVGPSLTKGCFDVEKLRKSQREDTQISSWIDGIGKEGTDSRMFLDKDGVLCLEYNGGRRTSRKPFGVRTIERVVVPECMIADALQLAHNAPLAGHMGFRRTWKRSRDAFWWKDMKKDVTEWVNNCEACGKNKHSTKVGEAPLQETDIPLRVTDKVQVDFLGPFSISTAHEYRYVLQVQDVLSRYLIFVPTVRNDAETAASAVFEEWVCKFGFPMTIQSDRGTHFSSQVFKMLCELNGMRHVMGSTGHAQSQGCVERQNQLVNQVRALCNNDIDKWPGAMLRIQYAHNVAVNESTKMSPYEIMFGQTARAPETLLGGGSKEGVVVKQETCPTASAVQVSTEAKIRLKGLLVSISQENTRDQQQKRNAKRETKAIPYKVGDLVRLKLNDPQKRALGGKKIAPRNSAAYEVTSVVRLWTYLLRKECDRDLKEPKLIQRHYNELVPCLKDRVPSSIGNKDMELEVTCQQAPTGEKSRTRKSPAAELSHDRAPLRRSERDRKPPNRLEVNPKAGKRYDSVTETFVDYQSDAEEGESEDSQH